MYTIKKRSERTMSPRSASDQVTASVKIFQITFPTKLSNNEWPTLVLNHAAAMGGLLGLGFGFSFISLTEMVYFFGIRWYFKPNQGSNQHRRRLVTVAVVGRNKHRSVKPVHHWMNELIWFIKWLIAQLCQQGKDAPLAMTGYLISSDHEFYSGSYINFLWMLKVNIRQQSFNRRIQTCFKVLVPIEHLSFFYV